MLAKSQYVVYCLCHRKAWLDLFNQLPSNPNGTRTQTGNEVGLLARDYFGKGMCHFVDPNMVPTTPGLYAEYPLTDGKNLLCYVDILRINNDNSIDIYEVKSTTDYRSGKSMEKKYLEDLSFQYYVAYKIGLAIKSINIIYLNKNYLYMGGSYDLNQLFIVDDVTAEISTRTQIVEDNIKGYFALDANNEIGCSFTGACSEYGGCQYLDICKKYKGLPNHNSVYDLYECQSKSKYIDEGILSFKELIETPYFETLSAFNQRMVIYSLQGIKRPYVNKEMLNDKFLKNIQFPLYFFDFETVSEALPIYPNSRPYQKIPFQYSLHIMNDANEDYKSIVASNKYFLGNGVDDPREELIKQMIADLGDKGSIMAYNMSFEKECIEKLAKDFPNYAKKLEKLSKRFIDLAIAFDFKERIGWKSRTPDSDPVNRSTSLVYHPLMGPSTSIKQVLPAFFPNDHELDYSKLGQVQHGDQASDSYIQLGISSKLSPSQKQLLRKDMLDYCCLDTKAMVAIYFELLNLAS